MLSNKDVEGFLRNFTGLARRLIAVPIHQDKGMPADILARIGRHVGLPADNCESVEAALGMIGDLALSPAPRILITGSLYLAGEVLSANGTPPN
jgi:dihydrofolate synthase/folylpolyglutamate synthase